MSYGKKPSTLISFLSIYFQRIRGVCVLVIVCDAKSCNVVLALNRESISQVTLLKMVYVKGVTCPSMVVPASQYNSERSASIASNKKPCRTSPCLECN